MLNSLCVVNYFIF